MKTTYETSSLGARIAILGTAALVGLLLMVPSVAEADTCTFASSTMMFDNAYANQTFHFSWDRASGAILQNGTTCSSSGTGTAYWDDLQSGTQYVYCGSTVTPGTVTPNYSTSPSTFEYTFSLYLSYQGVNYGHRFIGRLYNARPNGQVMLAGAFFGSNGATFSGYGTVTCN